MTFSRKDIFGQQNNGFEIIQAPSLGSSSSGSSQTLAQPPAGAGLNLPIRPRAADDNSGKDDVTVKISPISEKDGVIVTLMPPKGNHLTPIDLALVVDISESMNTPAPVQTTDKHIQELDGLEVLDLVKHTVKAVIQSCVTTGNDDVDELAIYTFNSLVQNVQGLTAMNAMTKQMACNKVEQLQPKGCTNLWGALEASIAAFNEKPRRPGRARAILLFTDGEPTTGDPDCTYTEALRRKDSKVPIYTFGFGPAIKSQLLQSIAEVTGGNYVYTPDSSMVGTSIIHAMANIRTTFAESAVLRVRGSSGLQLEEAMGEYIKRDNTIHPDGLVIPLGPLRYGQTRDIVLTYAAFDQNAQIEASLACETMNGSSNMVTTVCNVSDTTDMAPAEIQFHLNRALVCSFLSNLAKIRNDMRTRPRYDDNTFATFKYILAQVQQTDSANKSLRDDLEDQMQLAISREYYGGWGFHYLLSMFNAHSKQMCMDFKNPGIQQYGKNDLFLGAKQTVSDLFDTLKPAQKVVSYLDTSTNTYGSQAVNMQAQYNNCDNACFAGFSKVKLMDGSTVEVKDVVKGMKLWTPAGERSVLAVIESKVAPNTTMCRVGDLIITPWHPISVDGEWLFPDDVKNSEVSFNGMVYSIMMEQDETETDSNNKTPDAHVIDVDGHLTVTLGHGLTDAAKVTEDIRNHDFFGNHAKLVSSLATMANTKGVYQCSGLKKDSTSGIAYKFIPRVDEQQQPATQILPEIFVTEATEIPAQMAPVVLAY